MLPLLNAGGAKDESSPYSKDDFMGLWLGGTSPSKSSLFTSPYSLLIPDMICNGQSVKVEDVTCFTSDCVVPPRWCVAVF